MLVWVWLGLIWVDVGLVCGPSSASCYTHPLVVSLFHWRYQVLLQYVFFGSGQVVFLSIDESWTIKQLDIWMSWILIYLACLLLLCCSCCCGLHVSMCLGQLCQLWWSYPWETCNLSVVLLHSQGWDILLFLWPVILLPVVPDTQWGVQLCMTLDVLLGSHHIHWWRLWEALASCL